jgi:hypothetical protein
MAAILPALNSSNGLQPSSFDVLLFGCQVELMSGREAHPGDLSIANRYAPCLASPREACLWAA